MDILKKKEINRIYELEDRYWLNRIDHPIDKLDENGRDLRPKNGVKGVRFCWEMLPVILVLISVREKDFFPWIINERFEFHCQLVDHNFSRINQEFVLSFHLSIDYLKSLKNNPIKNQILLLLLLTNEFIIISFRNFFN